MANDYQATSARAKAYRNKYGRFPNNPDEWNAAADLTALVPVQDASKTAGGGLKNMFSNLKTGFNNNFGYSFRSPGSTGWGSGLNVGTAKGPGLTAFGLPIGKYANIGNAVMQGVNAAQGISDYSKGQSDINDLVNDIKVSAMGNPLLNSYLTSDQLSLLNKLQRGTYDTGADMDDFMSGLTSDGLTGAVQGAMSGAIGGLPGMAIGAIGGLVNGGIGGLSNANDQTEAELQALLTALQNAEMQYKSMQRPNFTGLGIQQQYQDMYR